MMLEFLESIKNILSAHSLCDQCLGRLFGNLATGLTSSERGSSLKTSLLLYLVNDYNLNHSQNFQNDLHNIAVTGFSPAQKTYNKYFNLNVEKIPCPLCNNIFSVDFFAQIATTVQLEVKTISFQTFLVGSLIPGSILEYEDNIRNKFHLEYSESLKSDFNREFGKYLSNTVCAEKKVDMAAPDIVFLVNIAEKSISLKQSSLFLYGRYQKLQRGIPQSTWHCRECRGKGCQRCNFSGLMYQDSVQKLIEEPLFSIIGSSATRFHGSGREDIDALMVGSGRPFVIEFLKPHIYTIDVNLASKLINEHSSGKILVNFESIVKKDRVRKIKTQSSSMRKSYSMKVELEHALEFSTQQWQSIIEFFTNREIEQQTPIRVLHRRADLLRKRMVYSITIECLSPVELTINVLCQGGLYVKELISGDEGRTRPNISEKLGIKAKVKALDVLAVMSPS